MSPNDAIKTLTERLEQYQAANSKHLSNGGSKDKDLWMSNHQKIEITKKAIRILSKVPVMSEYLQHKQWCNINKDWSELDMALADTPAKFRDDEYNQYCAKTQIDRNTCSCGLQKLSELFDNFNA